MARTIQLNADTYLRVPVDFVKTKIPLFEQWKAALESPAVGDALYDMALVDAKGNVLAECALGTYCRIAGLPLYPIPNHVSRIGSGTFAANYQPTPVLQLPENHPAFNILGAEGKITFNKTEEPLLEYTARYKKFRTDYHYFGDRMQVITAYGRTDYFETLSMIQLNDFVKLTKKEIAVVVGLMFC